MSNDRYLDDLARRLTGAGVPADRAAGVVDDLRDYLAEAGAGAEDEFGPVEAFAEQLTAPGPPHGPGPSEADETWAFHADAFTEMALLREFGDQGWEVVSYDLVKGFDCRRSLERPQRWEYLRKAVPPKRVGAVRERLAEDGWETAAVFGRWHYFKRPVAATTGPAAELHAPPEPPAAVTRSLLVNRGFIACFLAALAVLTVVLSLAVGVPGSRLAVVGGALFGLSIVAACGAGLLLHERRKASRG